MASKKQRLVSGFVARVGKKLEGAKFLDRIGEYAVSLGHRLAPPGKIRDIASGVPTGHPMHPPLATITMGAFLSSAVLDLTGSDRKAAQRLNQLGFLAAVPTAYAGLTDFSTTAQAERRVGLVHAACNTVALGCYGMSWLARRRGSRGKAGLWTISGSALLTAGGWLGGHLAYALGVGVDTTVFQQVPTQWRDVAAARDVQSHKPLLGWADSIPVTLFRTRGKIVALADRCTHRGGPLHEGTIESGCVVCPWHGSKFSGADGAVATGPATRPQPVFETRVVEGRVQVRRGDEQRSLRQQLIGS